MDFSKLSSNEKLAVYGAAASIIGPIVMSAGYGFALGWITLLLAVAMLAIVFLPQWSPQTTLPGSKGSLMLVVGGIAAALAVLGLLSGFGILGLVGVGPLFVVGWLIGIAGGLLMGWAGWQEFQAEGGKFQLGSAATPPTRTEPGAPAPTSSTASSEPAAPPPPAAPPAPPPDTSPPPPPAAPVDRDDENRPPG